MADEAVVGAGETLGGKVKETVGAATGDRSLQAGGMIDQVKGAVRRGMATGPDGQPEVVGRAKQFAKDRPWAAAALVGVVGMAVLNTLRGRR